MVVTLGPVTREPLFTWMLQVDASATHIGSVLQQHFSGESAWRPQGFSLANWSTRKPHGAPSPPSTGSCWHAWPASVVFVSSEKAGVSQLTPTKNCWKGPWGALQAPGWTGSADIQPMWRNTPQKFVACQDKTTWWWTT